MIFGSPPIVTNGLVLNLDAANMKSYPMSGTTWRDLSGFNNSGSLVNGPTFNSVNGGSIVFDGVDDLVSVANATSLNNTSGTVSVWFYNTGTYTTGNKAAEIINKHDAVGSYNGYGIVIFNINDIIQIQAYIKDASVNYFTSGSTILSSLWYNVSMTYQNTNQIIVYLNSQNVASRSVGTLTTNNLPLRIGTSNDSYFSPFIGRVANALLYNRALSQSEIQQNYNAQKSRFNLQ